MTGPFVRSRFARFTFLVVLLAALNFSTACYSRSGDDSGDDAYVPPSITAGDPPYEQVAAVDVGLGVNAIAYDAATRTMYSTLWDTTGIVSAISVDDAAILDSTIVTPGLHGRTALGADGRYLFVTNYDIESLPGDTVVRLDTQDDFAATGLTVGPWPCGAFADATDERVFVVTGCDGRTPVEDTGSGFAVIDMEAVDADHAEFIAIDETDYGEIKSVVPDPDDPGSVFALALHNGTANLTVMRVALDTGAVTASLDIEAELDEERPDGTLTSLTYAQGALWLTQGHASRLLKLENDLSGIAAEHDLPFHASGVAVRPDGVLAMADLEDHQIRLFDLGDVSEIAAFGAVHTGAALAFDETGDDLYVADSVVGVVRIFRRGVLDDEGE